MAKQGVYYSALTETVLRHALGALQFFAPKLVAQLAYFIFYTPLRRSNKFFKTLNPSEKTHQSRGKRIHIYLAGEGPPVLFVHGWEMNAAYYESLMMAVINAGFSIVSCDLPAHGKSAGKNTDIVEIGEVILDLNHHYGPFTAAIGHSYGAAALSRVMHNLEQHLRITVLFACPVTYESMIDLYTKIFGLRKKARHLFVEHIHARYSSFNIFFDRDLDFRSILKRLKSPLLIIRDTHDRVIPIDEGDTFAKSLTHATFLTTRGLGHRRILKDSAIIKNVVTAIQREINYVSSVEVVQ